MKIVYRMKFSTYSNPSEIMAIAVRTSSTLRTRNKPETASEKPTGIALLLYQHFTCNKISRLLVKHNIKTIHILMKKTSSTLRLIKDNQGLQTSGIYCIPCECDKVYVGQTASTIQIRYQEHIRHLPIGHTEKSTVAEHLLNTGHKIQLKKTRTHSLKRMSYVHGLDCERSHRNLNSKNFNREAGFMLNCTWQPVISLLKCFPQHQ
jgi:hypothetical protein